MTAYQHILILAVLLLSTCLVGQATSSDLYKELQQLKSGFGDSGVNFINDQIDKGFTVHDSNTRESEQGTFSNENLPDMLALDSNDLDSVEKRTLSVGGGLRSLAEMLYSQERARRQGYVAALFKQKGKRSWRFPMLGFNYLKVRTRPNKALKNVIRRRTNQLSVSGPLSALANMLAEEGRQRKQSQSLANRMKLIELGKRTDKTYTPFEEETLVGTKSDLDESLYR